MKEIYTLDDLKKGDIVFQIDDEIKKRFGKGHNEEFGKLEYIEPYSENRGLGHFKTESGQIITLKAREVRF